MKRILMLASLLAAGMPLGAQNLGSEYRLKRVIPVNYYNFEVKVQ